MTTKFIDNNGIVSFDSISSEKDLMLRPRININPPPTDGKCECCGRHISELDLFNTCGDSMLDNFKGALLVKLFRPIGPYDVEAEKSWNEAKIPSAFGSPINDDRLNGVLIKCMNEKGEIFYFSGKSPCELVSSWECSDCAVLDKYEYFQKLRERSLKKNHEFFFTI